MFGTSSHVVVLHHLRWMLVHITITSLLSYRSIGYNDHPSGCIPKGSRVKWSKARKCFTPCMRCECLHLSSRCEAPFRISVALEWGGHRLAKCCSHRTLPKRGIRPSREWSEHPRLPKLFFRLSPTIPPIQLPPNILFTIFYYLPPKDFSPYNSFSPIIPPYLFPLYTITH